MDKPNYPHFPIASIDALARCLGVASTKLLSISKDIDNSYSEFIIESKGKDRTVYEPKFELKRIQKRINKRIFEKVKYPTYLHGGIRDSDNKRDYVENARVHSASGCKTIIGLDVRNFYDNIKSDKVTPIFKLLFKFPNDVSELLTNLTTYRGKVPQGACTSSYIANLVFFNSEYTVVSRLRSLGISYTRLLDDVTLSSPKELSAERISECIRSVVALFKKHGLEHNKKKTRVENKKINVQSFIVTGLWVGHKVPKVTRHERRYIRAMVHACERLYLAGNSTDEYHEIWNKTSGLVAKLNRLEQSNHKGLRERLNNVLPVYDDSARRKIILDCKSLLRLNPAGLNYGQLTRLNLVYSKLGILSRNYLFESRLWRRRLSAHFKNKPKKSEVW